MDDADPAPLSRRQFASDNYAAIAPEAWQALERANAGHAPAYGEDTWTQRASDLVRELFETDCEVFFTFTGTAANALALASLCSSYHSVVCHELAHLETDECGAPEFFSNGTKILLAGGAHGKVDVDLVREIVTRRSDLHYPKPRALSITQATELGTVYRPDHLGEIGEAMRSLGLHLHMDGARFGNAVAALGVAPRELACGVGVDVMSLGGAKLGMPVGEMVVFFRRELAYEFEYRCKQAGQLASKMRFLAAPWIGMLESGAWLRYAANANRRASRLAKGLEALPGVSLLAPSEANAVFASLPVEVAKGLLGRGWLFYDFIAAGGARFMCSWDTSDSDVDALLADVADLTQEDARR